MVCRDIRVPCGNFCKIICSMHPFINKMDVSHRGKEELLSHLQEKLADACMDFGAFYGNAPMSDRDKEHIALCSEPLLDAFLNTGDLDQKLLVEAIAKRQIFRFYLGLPSKCRE